MTLHDLLKERLGNVFDVNLSEDMLEKQAKYFDKIKTEIVDKIDGETVMQDFTKTFGIAPTSVFFANGLDEVWVDLNILSVVDLYTTIQKFDKTALTIREAAAFRGAEPKFERESSHDKKYFVEINDYNQKISFYIPNIPGSRGMLCKVSVKVLSYSFVTLVKDRPRSPVHYKMVGINYSPLVGLCVAQYTSGKQQDYGYKTFELNLDKLKELAEAQS